MNMVSHPEQSSKSELRAFWKKKRHAIPAERKEEAIQAAFGAILLKAFKHHFVLSYASFGEEFNTEAINRALQAQGKLVLPKVVKESLHLYHISDVDSQLEMHRYGFGEPIPSKCSGVIIEKVTLVLVPGIAFDTEGHRLGYGKGYYDRFLCRLPTTAEAYGLGFNEQRTGTPLPATPLDHPLDGLLLF